MILFSLEIDSQPSPGIMKQRVVPRQCVMAMIWGAVLEGSACWGEAPGMLPVPVLKKRPDEVPRRISLATLGPFHPFMTDCSLKKCWVSCHSLSCLKGLFTHLYLHAGGQHVHIYLKQLLAMEMVLFLTVAPPHPQSFADLDQLWAPNPQLCG